MGRNLAQRREVTMVRKLKHHEQKLLRKVDFTTYKSDNNHRDAAVIRRYNIQKPADYAKYNRICGSLKQLAHRLAALPPDSSSGANMKSSSSPNSTIWGSCLPTPQMQSSPKLKRMSQSQLSVDGGCQ